MSNVTHIINAIEQGDEKATNELLPLVYEELRRLAAHKLAHEAPGQTFQATALVHEAYLRLLGARDQNWNSQGHFFKAAAEAMRRILVEHARQKKSLKRGGDRQRVKLCDSICLSSQEISPDDLLSLNDALDKLSREDSTTGELVELHYFAGLTLEQIAGIQGFSRRTAIKRLVYARAWLHRETTGAAKPIVE
jgi:RNA polymerase sigma factor (TIGR02999 family)